VSPQFTSSVYPEANGVLRVFRRLGGSVTMRHAAGEIRHIDDEDLVFRTPVDVERVLVWRTSRHGGLLGSPSCRV